MEEEYLISLENTKNTMTFGCPTRSPFGSDRQGSREKMIFMVCECEWGGKVQLNDKQYR